MKKNLVKKSLVAVVAASTLLFAACGSSAKNAEGSLTIDADSTANSGFINPQVSTMLQATTDVNLKVEDGNYTLTKEFSAAGTSGDKEVDVVYTFTGIVSESSGKDYTLDPATGCTYSVEWGEFYDQLEPAGLIPTEPGTGDQSTDAASLNYFYGPYLVDNGSNDQSITVTIDDGSLSFEGFSFDDALDD